MDVSCGYGCTVVRPRVESVGFRRNFAISVRRPLVVKAPQRNTRRKKKITLVKVYPSDGETAIFAVGKFGKSRMTMLSPVPATAQQE